MNLAQGLQQSGAIGAMARELGIDEATAQKGASALLPALVAGMGRDHVGAGGTRPGAGGLSALAGAGGGLGGGLLDQVLGSGATPTAPGIDILGQIFGSKDVSRGVADEAAGSTGIDPGLLKKMLPILAMAVVGYMARGQGGASGGRGGGLGGGLGDVLGGALGGGRSAGGGGMLGGILGQVVTGMLRR